MSEGLSKRERNKAERKAGIVETAKGLFVRQGFDLSSMDQIALEAGTTKRTVYQYFLSKEDLFYAVVLEAARVIEAGFAKAFAEGRDARDKLVRANAFYARLYLREPGLFRIWTFSPSDKASCAASPHRKEAEACRMSVARHYFDLMDEGRADGSLAAGADPRLAVFYCLFSTTSLLDFLSLLDPSFWAEQGLSQEAFIEYSFGSLMKPLFG
jgi:TetR/AcrR family transcriptional regulator